MRRRRRADPFVGVVVTGLILTVMTVIFVALGVREFHREHDRSWSYERVAYVGCRYDHTSKRTSYYDCGVGDPTTRALIYDGTVSVSTSYHAAPPASGTRWLRRIDGQVVDVGSKFPLWVEFFLLIPLFLFVICFLGWRKSRRRKRMGYGGATPTGFAPPGFGAPIVSDQPRYPGPSAQ